MSKYIDTWHISSDEFPADSYASDQLEFLLRYAVLAPSKYNTQPWLFRINVMDIEIVIDRRRTLKVVDPFRRELIMSCGAALLNLRVAAEYFGHTYKIDLLPEAGNPELLARFHLGLQGSTSGEDILIFNAITRRRTNRHPFEDRIVPENVLNQLEAAALEYHADLKVITDNELRHAISDLVAEADRQQWGHRDFRTELAHWIRPKPEDRGDGISTSIVGLKNWLAFAGPTLIRAFDRGNGMAASDGAILAHSPVLAVLSTLNDDPHAWLQAGQALENVLLHAEAEEVSVAFLNQPIEVPDLRNRLAEITGVQGSPQVLLRIGYGPAASPTPRRPARECLIMHKTTHD